MNEIYLQIKNLNHQLNLGRICGQKQDVSTEKGQQAWFKDKQHVFQD